MKVKNNVKGVLVLKSNTNDSVMIEEGGTHSFKKDELKSFSQAIRCYLDSGWLFEVRKAENPANPVDDVKLAPVEAITIKSVGATDVVEDSLISDKPKRKKNRRKTRSAKKKTVKRI